jgi:hypothetical protein
MLPINEKYSYKSFIGQSFLDRPVSDFEGMRIVGSDFSQEWGEYAIVPSSGGKNIFPTGIKNAEIDGCNMDNVFLQAGLKINDTRGVGCETTNKTIKIENDRLDWIQEKVLNQWQPKKCVNYKILEELGLPTDPNDIPATMQVESIIITKDEERAALLQR